MKNYKDELEALQCALVRMQQALIASGARTVLVLEGRDGAGKDGSIKRITEHLSPRNTRMVALPKPSDRGVRNGISSATPRICRQPASS